MRHPIVLREGDGLMRFLRAVHRLALEFHRTQIRRGYRPVAIRYRNPRHGRIERQFEFPAPAVDPPRLHPRLSQAECTWPTYPVAERFVLERESRQRLGCNGPGTRSQNG